MEDILIDDDPCGACGGVGFFEDECTCIDDICFCLVPDYPVCEQCNGQG